MQQKSIKTIIIIQTKMDEIFLHNTFSNLK